MPFQLDDTIAALASAAGPGGRGIIRISGPEAVAHVGSFFEPADLTRWRSTRFASVHRGRLRVRMVRTPIPAVVYRWPNARSFTGQSVIEIHAPGSPPLLEAILAHACELGARPAGPGEFTARAFLSGRVDLVQAEAVLGVIDASNEPDLASALRQLAGGISGRIAGVRDGLMDLLADLEAGLDFVEEDIAFISREEAARRIGESEAVFDELLERCRTRAHTAGRRRVVLAGLPNAGKSTLFNALLRKDAALVSPVAGTTRDYLRGQADWHGLAVELIDTAGWDLPVDEIMQRAGELRSDQWDQADLIVWCTACDLVRAERQREFEVVSSVKSKNRSILFVGTKADLGSTIDGADLIVSALNGIGLEALIAACVQALSGSQSEFNDLIGTTAARCRESLFHGRESLARALRAVEMRDGDELIAIEIREALSHLGRILGTVYTDDILDRIFSRFCIGK